MWIAVPGRRAEDGAYPTGLWCGGLLGPRTTLRRTSATHATRPGGGSSSNSPARTKATSPLTDYVARRDSAARCVVGRRGGVLVVECVRLLDPRIDRHSDFQHFWLTRGGHPDPDSVRSIAGVIPTRLDVICSERSNHFQRGEVGGCVEQHKFSHYAHISLVPTSDDQGDRAHATAAGFTTGTHRQCGPGCPYSGVFVRYDRFRGTGFLRTWVHAVGARDSARVDGSKRKRGGPGAVAVPSRQ